MEESENCDVNQIEDVDESPNKMGRQRSSGTPSKGQSDEPDIQAFM